MVNSEIPSDLARKYRTAALSALTRLANGDRRPKTLHRLRTNLRRLQAYAELVGETGNARIMAECVSHFSPLRTLDVLEAYLAKHGAPLTDLAQIRTRIMAKRKKLRRNQIYQKVEGFVIHHAVPPVPGVRDWLGDRMSQLREVNNRELRGLAIAAAEDVSRKTLHVLRLKIKSVRYQEEWVVHEPYGLPEFIQWLKVAQKALGEYEERGQFRKLARKLGLDSREQIERDWTRARKRARALPAELLEKVHPPVERHLHLVKSDPQESQLPA